MMYQFLSNNRVELVRRCRAKVQLRPARGATVGQLANGVPMFLDQLIRTLEIEQSDEPMESRRISGPSGGGVALSEMGVTAAQHGRELLELGFTVDQVVHDYGDLCQSVTDLAHERDAPFSVDEFRTLNRCLDNAIADAVAEFSYQHDAKIAGETALAENERLGFLAHELRNHLHTATVAFTAAKVGALPLTGATGGAIERSLGGMRALIDRSLTEVRLSVSPAIQVTQFAAVDFIAEIKYGADLFDRVRGCRLLVSPIDLELAFSADRDLLASAVGNLVQNAFKFSHPESEIRLDVYASGDKIHVDVADHCGGLEPGVAETMFESFKQSGEDRSGLGLGLSIAKRAVELNDGSLSVQNVPGVGCIFTIIVPRHELPIKQRPVDRSVSMALESLSPDKILRIQGEAPFCGVLHTYAGKFAVLPEGVLWEVVIYKAGVSLGKMSASLGDIAAGTELDAAKAEIELYIEQGRWRP